MLPAFLGLKGDLGNCPSGRREQMEEDKDEI